MAQRSTRNKIKYQAKKALGHLESVIQNLAKLSILADEKSTYVNDTLPQIILMLDGCKVVLTQFDEKL